MTSLVLSREYFCIPKGPIEDLLQRMSCTWQDADAIRFLAEDELFCPSQQTVGLTGLPIIREPATGGETLDFGKVRASGIGPFNSVVRSEACFSSIIAASDCLLHEGEALYGTKPYAWKDYPLNEYFPFVRFEDGWKICGFATASELASREGIVLFECHMLERRHEVEAPDDLRIAS